MNERTQQPLTLDPREVDVIRHHLDRAAENRPTTVAGQAAHYVHLVSLAAVVRLVLDDAAERQTDRLAAALRAEQDGDER